MILTIMERMMALGVLPEKGNLAQIRLHNGLINKLGLSAEEMTEYEVKQEGDQMLWRQDLPQEKDIDLKPAEVVFIADALKKKNDAGELVPQHLTLYDKIVDEE